MLIITGHVMVDPAEREEYVAAHADLVRRARQAPGCLDMAICADPVDPARVNNLERWESKEHLDAWREVADAPARFAQIVRGDVRMYTVTGEEQVFELAPSP
jgi:quinol monooxygenase YgiN